MLLLSDLRRLLYALTKLVTDKSLLSKLIQHFSFYWSILRARWRRGRDPPKGLEPSRSNSGVSGGMESQSVVRYIQYSDTAATFDGAPDTIDLSDKAIACSLHPYMFSRNGSRSSHDLGARSSHDLRARSSHDLGAPVREFTSSYPSLPRQHDGRLSPTSRRSFERSAPQLPIPFATELLSVPRSRSASPVHSIVVLPAVEGPSGMLPNLPTKLSERFPRICPQAPETFQRYWKTVVVPKVETDITIEPLTTSFARRDDPPGWASCLHPEGACYFYHEQKRIYTDADLHDPEMLQQITEDITDIYDFMRVNDIILSPTVDLVLDLVKEDDGEISNFYYFADHKTRAIFFLDTFKASSFSNWQSIQGVTSQSHLGHEIEAQYWFHVQLFPISLQITHELVNELRDILMHVIGDSFTSSLSTAPYSLEDLQKMLSLANSLKKNVGTSYGGSTHLLSRFMWVFARHRFHNWYGEPSARLNRDHSVHGSTTNKRTMLVKTLSPLLFSAPDIHLRSLEKMWVDGLMNHSVWTRSMEKLNSEWQEFILYATVLLNANVAFLAIQTVDQNGHPYRSPAQISSYLSTVSSIGSIILGLLLVRQNRTKAKETAGDALRFLHERKHPTLGLESLAIMFSLPYALLMWGMVGFLSAFSFMCLENSNTSTRTLIAVGWGAIAILIAWCIWMAWEKKFHEEPSTSTTGDTSSSSDRASTKRSSLASKRRWNWPTIFNQRYSYDSNSTAV